MSSINLLRIGNSFGFKIPKTKLEIAGFDESSDYEIIAEKGVIFFVRKSPHHSKWIFKNTALSSDDKNWLESTFF